MTTSPQLILNNDGTWASPDMLKSLTPEAVRSLMALQELFRESDEPPKTESTEELVDMAQRLFTPNPDVPEFEGKTAKVYIEKGAIRVEAREVDFIASTDDIDSDGDIVEQDFIFERFLKNPIILFGHNSRSLPIGQAKNIRVEGGMLRLTVKFASKQANPVAENVFLLIKEEVLRAMSIGFIPRDVRRELRDDKEVFVLSKNELIEASVVPIPANQNAIVDAKSKALKTF